MKRKVIRINIFPNLRGTILYRSSFNELKKFSDMCKFLSLAVPGPTPDNVYLLSDCPHDWLFPRCAAVVRISIALEHFYF